MVELGDDHSYYIPRLAFKRSILLTAITCLVIGYAISSTHHSFYGYKPPTPESQPKCFEKFYSVAFDAGSTGTRVFVFQFRLEDDGKGKGSVIKLNKEFYFSTEPGISSFAHNIPEVSRSLKPHIQHALKYVPERHQQITLLLFKATAGLRLLPKEIRDEILDEVRFSLQESPFYIPDLRKVEVMGGDEEGLFGWITANFLLDTLWKVTDDETTAVLDLGGGSVQVTFTLPSITSYTSICTDGIGKVYKIHLLQSSYYVFTHSALGSGLKSAYLYIMGGQEEIEESDEKPREIEKEKLHLSSPCFEPNFESTWQHGRYTYSIFGEESAESRFTDCKRRVDDFVKNSDLTQVAGLGHKDVYLFSYFFDVPRWTGMIPINETNVLLTPLDFLKGAQQHCQQKYFSEDKPFHCMSLLYIYSLLTKALRLPDERPLHVAKELNGRQLSWTLGSALSTLNDQFNYSDLCDAS